MKFRAYIIGVLSLLLFSCTTNRSTINELYSLQEELEYSDEYNIDDWEDYFSRYEELMNEMAQRSYSEDELTEIARVQGQITAQLTKKSIRQVEQELERLPNLLNGFLEGFSSEMAR